MSGDKMIKVVGIGAGGKTLTLEAIEAIRKAEVIIGYSRYLDMIRDYIENAEIISSDVSDIKLRIEESLKFSDKNTVVISSGDPMIYGMGSRLFKYNVEIIPGVTAASLASSIAKVPLDDFVTISLSTYTRSLKEIENKLISAINGNFTIVIYNINPIARKESALLAENTLKKYAIDWDYYMIYNARRAQEKTIHGKINDLDIKIANMDTILMVKKW